MDLLPLLGRMALVFALLGAVLLVLKRSDALRARTGGGSALKVLSSTRLAKTATVTVVEVDGRRLVLGVTGSGVSVLTELGAEDPADPVAALEAAPAVRALPPAVTPVTPPTVAAFLADAWSCVRRRPLACTDLSDEDVDAALAALDRTAPEPADGSAAPRASADRRDAARTDAALLEESPWSRARPVPRTSGKDAALV